ncbi:MAG TPA: hypothetical protein VMO26_10320 [Vicinamibacterales bacterium]|nr:hypothetical protein [Vicinamibacterales bacterium]
MLRSRFFHAPRGSIRGLLSGPGSSGPGTSFGVEHVVDRFLRVRGQRVRILIELTGHALRLVDLRQGELQWFRAWGPAALDDVRNSVEQIVCPLVAYDTPIRCPASMTRCCA